MELAKRGVPVVLVGTDRFEPLARQVAASIGADWLPEVVVSHPIGGRTPSDLAVLCEAAWVALVEQFPGVAGSRQERSTLAPSSVDVRPDAVDGPGDHAPHSSAISAALSRVQETIDDGYRLELEPDNGNDGYVLRVIAEDSACAECLVPDHVLASIVQTEVEEAGGRLGPVRVEHGID